MKRKSRKELVERYVQLRLADLTYDAENETSWPEEAECLLRALADKTSDEDLGYVIAGLEMLEEDKNA